MSMLQKLSDLNLEKPADRYNNFLYVRIMASTMVVAGHSLGLSKEYTKESMAYFSILGFPIHGLGVLIFFLLSGYLVSTSLFNSNSIKDFFLSRAVRILPGLTVCVALVVFFLGPLLSDLSTAAYFSDSGTWRYLVNNMMLVNAEFRLPGVGHVVNGSLWTIPIEARLYLLLGCFGCLWSLRNKTYFTCFVFLVLGLLSLDALMIISLSKDNVNVVMCFLIGSAFFVFRGKIYLSGRISLALVALAFVGESTVFGRPLMFIALGYLILLFGYSKKLPVPDFVSDYSYGIYLYSFPIQSTLVYMFPDVSALKLLFVSVPLSWIAGAASWYWIEKPVGRLRKKFLLKNKLLVE